MSYKSGVCNFCGTGCGNLLKVEKDAVQGVFPSPAHPVSKGRLCVRGWHIHELLNTKERLSKPFIRENGTEKIISYDEAINSVVDNLSKYSGDEIAFLASPRSSNEDNYLLMKLARSVFKTNNISLASDAGHKNSVAVLKEGTGFPGSLGSVNDIAKADLVLVLGIDITKQNPIIGSEIHKAQNQGANVITISSKKTQIAKLSSKHYSIKPGSKKVFLAAVARAIIENELYDKEYVKNSTVGFEGFANTLGNLSNEDIPHITGIDYTEIQSLAKQIVESNNVQGFFSSGISGLDKDTIGHFYNLFLTAGKIGKQFCSINPVAGICNIVGSYDMGVNHKLLPGYKDPSNTEDRKRLEDLWKTDIAEAEGKNFYTSISENKSIKAIIVFDHDEEIIRYSKELSQIEYIVYIGSFQNNFIQKANVVLPVLYYSEYEGTYTNTERRVQYNSKKLETKDSVLKPWQLIANIAKRKGHNWDYTNAGDIFKEITTANELYKNMTYDSLTESRGIQWPCDENYPEGCNSFITNGPKEPLHFFKISSHYEKQNTTAKRPFLLMTGKADHFWHQNNLMKKTYIPNREYNATLLLYPEGFVEISREDAEKLGVRDKWTVKVVSDKGEVKISVKVTDDVKSGTAFVPYFIKDMVSSFLLEHGHTLEMGEDSYIPVNIERV